MGLLESLLKAERKIQKRIDQLFGTGASATPLEMRRDILDEVENCLLGQDGENCCRSAELLFGYSRRMIT